MMLAPIDDFAHHEPDASYESLVSYCAEICAVGQFRPIERRKGGSPGYAVMNLKGACRDAMRRFRSDAAASAR